MNINTTSTITILPTRKEKSASQVQRKLFGDDTNMNSKHCSSFEGKIMLTDKSVE